MDLLDHGVDQLFIAIWLKHVSVKPAQTISARPWLVRYHTREGKKTVAKHGRCLKEIEDMTKACALTNYCLPVRSILGTIFRDGLSTSYPFAKMEVDAMCNL